MEVLIWLVTGVETLWHSRVHLGAMWGQGRGSPVGYPSVVSIAMGETIEFWVKLV